MQRRCKSFQKTPGHLQPSEKVLVDTSAWLEFDRATGSSAEATLLASDRDLAAIATVMHLHLDEASLSV